MPEPAKATHEDVRFRNESLTLFHDNGINETYPLHWHEAVEIIMPLDGAFCVQHNQTTYRLEAGDILILSPNVPHAVPASKTRRYILLGSLIPLCSQKFYDSVRQLLPPVVMLSGTRHPALHAAVKRLLEGIVQETRDPSPASGLSIYAGLLQIMAVLTKQAERMQAVPCQPQEEEGVRDSRMASACDYIHQHYMEKLTLEEMAQACGFSKYHFERLFKRHTAQTFYQYLNGIRIKHAAMLLADNTLSVTDIAYRTGFPSISSFIRMFHIQYQCTPSAYRSACRQDGGMACAQAASDQNDDRQSPHPPIAWETRTSWQRDRKNSKR
jgi:AraC-like DNA-binding protein